MSLIRDDQRPQTCRLNLFLISECRELRDLSALENPNAPKVIVRLSDRDASLAACRYLSGSGARMCNLRALRGASERTSTP